MAIDKPNWFSIKDAADYLNVGEPTIYRWMRDGRITFRKVGDSTRFLQADLDAMVEVHPSEKDAQIVQDFCPACHGTEMVTGKLQSAGNSYFRPDHKQTKFWTMETGDVGVDCLMCATCGHINFFGDTKKLAKLRIKKDNAGKDGAPESANS